MHVSLLFLAQLSKYCMRCRFIRVLKCLHVNTVDSPQISSSELKTDRGLMAQSSYLECYLFECVFRQFLWGRERNARIPEQNRSACSGNMIS